MEETSVKTRWYDTLWAALIFFTRLPFWRVYQPPQASYKAVVEFWPLTGWLNFYFIFILFLSLKSFHHLKFFIFI